MSRQLHLNLFLMSRGHHEGAWRHPASNHKPLTDLDLYVEAAQIAEAAKFDAVFLADTLVAPNSSGVGGIGLRLSRSSFCRFCLRKLKKSD
jgi:alkanesulfonate monooxygenase SsuD/methylene tetrahydromethanopterin reductase-like flavin-dependent oxidoreductase (luciferase family)